MQRPVWLLSLDSGLFDAPPMATGALKAYHQRYGATAEAVDIDLAHFHDAAQIAPWLAMWEREQAHRADAALAAGQQPVVGLSVYTWNAAEFLDLARRLRARCPGLLIVAGGPHVQRPEDYLGSEAVDVIVMGEGEETFSALLDCPDRTAWGSVQGLAYAIEGGGVTRTPERPRCQDLDRFPSALDVIELRDADGKPRYGRVGYETSRGCPFRCAFCEWGTGAIGTKMVQFSLPRIRSDIERLIEGGVQDVWLCDSNFGALREDLDKARIIIELRQRTGMPSTFATSWSKHHNERVQQIVLLLHEHGLLQAYTVALQTQTPLALKLSNRKNMRVNQYEPIAKSMAAHGVPVSTELIWGLPGDNLAEFEQGLDRLLRVFPNINIFGYTLLPGTEFYDRRDEYRIETIPVAGYGKAKGEYVLACHTFDRTEGAEGYFLISAHILLNRGWVIPRTARLMALDGRVSASRLLREVLHALARAFVSELPGLDPDDCMDVYERREELYMAVLANREASFAVIRGVVAARHVAEVADAAWIARVEATLAIDEACCPRVGPARRERIGFGFDVAAVAGPLDRMELPPAGAFDGAAVELDIDHPGGVGDVLQNPDGGSWMQGRMVPAVRSSDLGVALQ